VIQFWSAGAEVLFGHRSADVTGSRMDVIIPAAPRERHRRGWLRAWDDGMIRDNLVALIPVLCKDGVVRARRAPPAGICAHGRLVAAMGIWSPASEDDARLLVLG
jgi:hypothetical protein